MYKIVNNYCDCHPETCCCDPYKIVDDKGERVATFYSKKDAQKLLNVLNKSKIKAMQELVELTEDLKLYKED